MKFRIIEKYGCFFIGQENYSYAYEVQYKISIFSSWKYIDIFHTKENAVDFIKKYYKKYDYKYRPKVILEINENELKEL